MFAMDFRDIHTIEDEDSEVQNTQIIQEQTTEAIKRSKNQESSK